MYKFDDTKVRIVGDVAIVTGQNTITGVFERVYSKRQRVVSLHRRLRQTGWTLAMRRKPGQPNRREEKGFIDGNNQSVCRSAGERRTDLFAVH